MLITTDLTAALAYVFALCQSVPLWARNLYFAAIAAVQSWLDGQRLAMAVPAATLTRTVWFHHPFPSACAWSRRFG